MTKRFRKPALYVAAFVAMPLLVVRMEVPDMAVPKAPGATCYSFVVFSDTQQTPVVDWVTSGGAPARRAVRERIAELDPAFAILAGDAVGMGCYKPSWNRFRKEYHAIPIWPVIGNHDLIGPNRPGLRNYFEVFPHVGEKRWYALRYPPVLLLMLDSNLRTLSDEEREEQKKWFRAELERARGDDAIQGICFVIHHPPLSVHRSGGDEAILKNFWEVAAKERKFMAAFSGHNHSYQHIQAGDRHAFVTGGGGATLFLCQREVLPESARLVKARIAHHLLHVEVKETGLRVVMHERQSGDNWEEREEIELPWLRPGDQRTR